MKTQPEASLNLLREYAQKLEYAESQEDLRKLYEEMSGHNSAADDPSASFEDLRKLCHDYLKEECFSAGIHCDDVLNPTVSDEERSLGPWRSACR